MPAVVSDSSPLIYLARLGRMNFLQRLFDVVFVPDAVWDEVAVAGGNRVEAVEVKRAAKDGWLRVERPDQQAGHANAALDRLDMGEREAIVLARQKNATLLMDEAVGRAVARQLGISCTGTLGVLVEAKLRGWLPSVRAELNYLQQHTNFRFTPNLFAMVLRAVGETD